MTYQFRQRMNGNAFRKKGEIPVPRCLLFRGDDRWLRWEPFGYAHLPTQARPTREIVDKQEDLHNFGLVAGMDGGGQPSHSKKNTMMYRGGTQPGNPKLTARRGGPPVLLRQPPRAHKGCEESATDRREGGKWETKASGRNLAGAGYEERQSAALLRAIAMNNVDKRAYHNEDRLDRGGIDKDDCHGNGYAQVQTQHNGDRQYDEQFREHQHQHQQQQQRQYGATPPPHLPPHRYSPSRFSSHQTPPPKSHQQTQMSHPQVPPTQLLHSQYSHVAHPAPQRPYYTQHHGQCNGCGRGPCNCEHVY